MLWGKHCPQQIWDGAKDQRLTTYMGSLRMLLSLYWLKYHRLTPCQKKLQKWSCELNLETGSVSDLLV